MCGYCGVYVGKGVIVIGYPVLSQEWAGRVEISSFKTSVGYARNTSKRSHTTAWCHLAWRKSFSTEPLPG